MKIKLEEVSDKYHTATGDTLKAECAMGFVYVTCKSDNKRSEVRLNKDQVKELSDFFTKAHEELVKRESYTSNI